MAMKKFTVIGGGSSHVLNTVRDMAAFPDVFSGVEIALYDVAPERAELMSRAAKLTLSPLIA